MPTPEIPPALATLAAALRRLLADGQPHLVALDYRAPAKLLRKRPDTGDPCPWPDAQETTRVVGSAGFDYAAELARVRGPDAPPPVVGERPWGERDGPLVRHKGALYLDLLVRRVVARRWDDGHGNPLPEELVKPYLPTPDQPRELNVRTYRLDRVVSLRREPS